MLPLLDEPIRLSPALWERALTKRNCAKARAFDDGYSVINNLAMETLSTLHRNVQEICRMEDEALRARSAPERFGDFVAQQAGRIWFIALHVLWFGAWALV